MIFPIKSFRELLADIHAWIITDDFNHQLFKRVTLCEPYRWKDGNLRHIAMSEVVLPVSVASMRHISALAWRFVKHEEAFVGFEMSSNFLEMWKNESNKIAMKQYKDWQKRLPVEIQPPAKITLPEHPNWFGYQCNIIEDNDKMRMRVYWVIQGYMDIADKERYMDKTEGDDRYGYSLHQSSKVRK
jgi:hypothetical protein